MCFNYLLKDLELARKRVSGWKTEADSQRVISSIKQATVLNGVLILGGY
jgi:hypothetical protein